MLNREPVRAAMYPILALIVAFLVGKGIIGQDDSAFVLALAALILGAIGIEVARSQVSPTKDHE